MKRTLLFTLMGFLSLIASNIFAQSDTLKIMYYNVLLFPGTAPERVAYFKTIMKEAQPDLLLINELEDNNGALSLLNDALNTDGVTYYEKATFVDGPDTDNMLFYNKSKFVLNSQDVVTTALRDISRYEVYYKSPDIATRPDTIFLNLFSAHLKASSGFEAERLAEIQDFYAYLSAHPNMENIILGGDMNFYSSTTETAYNEIVNNSTYPLTDVESAGDWGAFSYAHLHTQSTRLNTGGLGGGSTGGMDDRFDFIFFAQDVINGLNDVKYQPNTYHAFGNDGTGNTYNDAINSVSSTMYSQTLLDALFYMSDHLPVISNIIVNDDNTGFCPDSMIVAQDGEATIEQEDFESATLGNWTPYSAVGFQSWYAGTYAGNYYAYMNEYSGGHNANEDWLISPQIDFTKHNPVTFSFDNACTYTGPDIQVLVSTDYDGVSDPNTATWTSCTANLSAGSYAWANSGVIDLSSHTGTGYIAFKYTTDATDNGKVWEIDNITINGYVKTVSNISCNGANDGAIDLLIGDGVTPHTFVWSSGQTTEDISGLTPGTYTVTVNDATGCEEIKTYVITEPAPIVAFAGNDIEICSGSSTVLTATGGSNYEWSTTETTASITVNPTIQTTYTVIVSDVNGCNDTDDVIVSIGTSLTPSITPNGSTTFCEGGNVTLDAGVYTSYNWSNGASGQTIVVATSGDFSVTVTDASGCSGASSILPVTVYTNPTPTIIPSGATTFCEGGSVVLSVGNFSQYLWSTGQTVQNINVNSTGDYTITVTDGNGCSGISLIESVTVNSPTVPTITASGSTIFCDGESVILTSSEASGNLWSTSENTQSIIVSTSGAYSVEYTDGNNCTATSENVTIIVNTPIVPNITGSGPTTFCEGDSVSLVSDAATSYLWSNGETSQSIVVNSSGDYSVETVDVNNCSATSNIITVQVNTAVTPTITASGAITFCEGDSVELSSSLANGYLWSTGETSQSIFVTESGDYSVEIVDVNTCSATSSITTITVNTATIPTITVLGNTTFCEGDSVVLSSSEPTGNLWNTGETTQYITVLSAGNYYVENTNGNNCIAESEIIAVNVDTMPIVDLGSDTTYYEYIVKNNLPFLDAGNSGSSYLWSTGDTTQSIYIMETYTNNGVYTFWVDVINGACTIRDSIDILIIVVGNEKLISNKFLNIYPNPNNGEFYIENNENKTLNVEVYNVNGDVVFEKSINQDLEKISLSNISSGVYIIKANTENKLFNQKMIVR